MLTGSPTLGYSMQATFLKPCFPQHGLPRRTRTTAASSEHVLSLRLLQGPHLPTSYAQVCLEEPGAPAGLFSVPRQRKQGRH